MKYHEAWKNLCETDGVIVPGGFGLRGVEGKLEAARHGIMNIQINILYSTVNY